MSNQPEIVKKFRSQRFIGYQCEGGYINGHIVGCVYESSVEFTDGRIETRWQVGTLDDDKLENLSLRKSRPQIDIQP